MVANRRVALQMARSWLRVARRTGSAWPGTLSNRRIQLRHRAIHSGEEKKCANQLAGDANSRGMTLSVLWGAALMPPLPTVAVIQVRCHAARSLLRIVRAQWRNLRARWCNARAH
jgi:hypothetical protein